MKERCNGVRNKTKVLVIDVEFTIFVIDDEA